MLQRAGQSSGRLTCRRTCSVVLPRNASRNRCTHQIDQNTWIEIAATRAHDHAAARGQSHARIDRITGFDRGDACAVAEMRDDQAIGQIVRKLAHDRFAR